MMPRYNLGAEMDKSPALRYFISTGAFLGAASVLSATVLPTLHRQFLTPRMSPKTYFTSASISLYLKKSERYKIENKNTITLF